MFVDHRINRLSRLFLWWCHCQSLWFVIRCSIFGFHIRTQEAVPSSFKDDQSESGRLQVLPVELFICCHGRAMWPELIISSFFFNLFIVLFLPELNKHMDKFGAKLSWHSLLKERGFPDRFRIKSGSNISLGSKSMSNRTRLLGEFTLGASLGQWAHISTHSCKIVSAAQHALFPSNLPEQQNKLAWRNLVLVSHKHLKVYHV